MIYNQNDLGKQKKISYRYKNKANEENRNLAFSLSIV